MDNPERHVIDAIDALVDEQLTHPQDNYNAPFVERCDLCYAEWHGLPSDLTGCPGAYADDQQRAEWLPPEKAIERASGLIASVFDQLTVICGIDSEAFSEYLDSLSSGVTYVLPHHDSEMPYAYHEHFAPPHIHQRCEQCQRHLPRGSWVGPPYSPQGLCEECYTMQEPSRRTQRQLGQGHS